MERPSPARDRHFMKNALNISLRGIGNTWPNPSVGVVVVKNDQIISRGWTQPGGKPHAEIVALKKKNFFGATLYTTLEPCSHHGKTPPCVDQIIKSKINRVVIGLKDPNPKINGKGIRKLKKKKIKVTIGVLQKEIKKIHFGFFYKIKKNKPFIASKIAISKNGKMINPKKEWITSEVSRKYGNFLRSKYDAIITGINTVLKDNPLLNCRHYGMENLSPVRFILDSNLRIKENLKIVKTAKDIRTYVFTNKNNKEKIMKLKKLGLKIKILNKNLEKIDLKKAMFVIAKMGFNNVLLESGPNLNSAFLKNNLINKIYYFQSNNIIKSNEITLMESLKKKRIENLNFKHLSSKNINGDILKIYEK
jgi:diaminohydroxyphosphoribosylaminopyrimidine deaminase/5-amino-6-(5-phosphoribosylamino)uracil reductase